ncbi:cell wall hydrolase [Sphingobium algorifonticola]|nr:cell wall hydrolase [Sphingobium algorifonticola]
MSDEPSSRDEDAGIARLTGGKRRAIAIAVIVLAAGLALLMVMRLSPAFVAGDNCAPTSRCGSHASRIERLDDLPALPDGTAAGPDPQASLVPRDEARRINASVPFSKLPLVPAMPFRFRGSADDRARAVQCLAAAMLYEAGLSADGQRAVAQVVLNRVRHPAFPSTICGVVYQGRERQTGCQFTFTCDGSLVRPMPAAWWTAAKSRAQEALDGTVFGRVGLSTHYHTDWVHPYWSASLDKVSGVDTHLFFRWRGHWGTRAAFRQAYAGGEAQLGIDGTPVRDGEEPVATTDMPVTEAPAVALVVPPPLPPLPAGLPAAALRDNVLRIVHPDDAAFGLALTGKRDPETYIGVAVRLCRDLAFCHVMGWLDGAAVPRGFPVPPTARALMSFSYRRDRTRGIEEIRFDCEQFPRRIAAQCL